MQAQDAHPAPGARRPGPRGARRWIARLLPVARAIDRASERIGHAAAWLALAMVLIGAFNAVARYLARFVGRDLGSNAYIELQWYLFSALFLLGGAATLRRDQHVRVDVLYGRLGPRGRAWIDVLGAVLFLLPFCALMLWLSWPYVASSFRVREDSPDPDGLPRYPIKALILVGFALLLLQGASELVKRLALLLGLTADADAPKHEGHA